MKQHAEKSVMEKAANKWLQVKWQLSMTINISWGEEVAGYADIIDTPSIPDCNIFQPGGILDIRIRFFNLTSSDDGVTDFRCAFLKFGSVQTDGPFDLCFMTGRVSPFHDISTLKEFTYALEDGKQGLKQWALKEPFNYYALVDGLRKLPDACTSLDYNSYITYSVTDDKNERHLFRFRLVGEGDHDKAKLTLEEQAKPWDVGRPDVELPSGNYLADKLLSVSRSTCYLKLQTQVRNVGVDGLKDSWKNPCIAWDEEECPWSDLANIALTQRIPKDAAERAHYSFSTLPEGVAIATMDGMESYADLVVALEKVLTSSTRTKIPDDPLLTNPEPEMTTYLISIETGYHMYAGTNATVEVILIGTYGRTPKLILDKNIHTDFNRASKGSYYIQAPAVGEIKLVKIYPHRGTMFTEWYMRSMVIFDLEGRKVYDFPCYSWITTEITLLKGQVTFAHKETDPDLLLTRRKLLAEKRKMIPWCIRDGLPSRVGYLKYKDLPRDLQFPKQREWEKKLILVETAVKLKLHRFMTMFDPFDSFRDFLAMTKVLEISDIATAITDRKNWKRDEEFGREMLAGFHPLLIRRCSHPLESFPVTDEMLKHSLDRGKTLHEEMEAGHVYILDYSVMEGVPRRSDSNPKYLANPLCMLYVKNNGRLVPIAIQLEQRPGKDNPIWTSSDRKIDWLFAKMWVKSADTHMHCLSSHLFRAHFVTEALAISTMRNLPSVHPVFKLLIPHLNCTIAVNTTGIEVLLQGEDSIFQKLLAVSGSELDFIRSAYRSFHWDDMNIPKDLAKRGVEDPDLLPRYWYRDDSLMLWESILEFVSRVMNIFYSTDDDVRADEELQHWMKENRERALPQWNGRDNGVPGNIENLSQLNEILTMIIFSASCFHAAINFGQIDYYAFGPNYPGSMKQPPPTTKGVTNMETILKTLPTKADQALSIAFAYYLSSYSKEETFLGDFPDAHFVEPEVREAQKWFKTDLNRISDEIKRRNMDLEIPYTYLLPENIPNSVSV
ncbi:hypothetical protein CHS0354_008868 [Potamilus streckersoni]|uniref:Lipoxygenase n=1 Tax=Potamilus streckersoni TaxID=2493646 RepID=A0AAE0RU65_9BIVA|nr:hypothetical protein CHS0354_008868 [Potamilus streckersoni]